MEQRSLGRSAEDYLEAMLILKERLGYVRSVDIAEQLGVSKPSVSLAVKRLRERDLIEMNRSGFITLKEAGMEVASAVYNRHKVLAGLFMALGVKEEVASNDACRIEHVISEETFSALCAHAETLLGAR